MKPIIEKKGVIAIDPGNEKSAYVIWNGQEIIRSGIVVNEQMLSIVGSDAQDYLVIEKVACYGMPVGETVFETVYWTGRFCEAWSFRTGYGYRTDFMRLPRHEVKMHLCHNMRAKDGNIRQALIDRFGENPTKQRPNPIYGENKISKDMWQAWALAVTYWDEYLTATIAEACGL